MKNVLKVLLGIILVFILTFSGFRGYQQYLAPTPPTATSAPVISNQEPGPQIVSAEGKVVPLYYAQLSFKIPGLVENVPVSKGSLVESGDLIGSLEGREQIEASLAAAKAALLSAEQTREEIIQLAPLKTAQAQQDLAYAQDTLEEVQRRWSNSQEGNRGSGEAVQSLELQLLQAKEAVARAEEEYAKYSGRPENDPIRLIAYSALLTAKRLETKLQGQLTWYQSGPSTSDQAILDAELALAEERLAEAERQWEKRKDGPDQEQLALAEAQVESAKAQLAAIEASLADLELRAPFTGTIISLELKVGEAVSPAIPVVVLADVSRWQVETIDLTENDFALLKPGMETIITLTAYPGQEFRGIVREISLLGEDRRGSVTYTVTIDFDPDSAIVQWGMTAFVDIPLR